MALGSRIDIPQQLHGSDSAASVTGSILIVDDDPDIAACAEINLSLAGYRTSVVSDGHAALDAAREHQPDLIILDVMMPGLDGFSVCRALRHDPRTASASIIMLTARVTNDDKVRGLTIGADDYMAKPFDPGELVARVAAALRRTRQMRGVSPLTGLPGNFQISSELERLCATADAQFCVMHVDLDNFKAFNDAYGFARGDAAISMTAHILSGALERLGVANSFLGHIGGDDFVLIAPADSAESLASDIVRSFDTAVPDLYDPSDRANGYLESRDRRGATRRYRLMSISIGIASTALRPLASHWQAAAIASEMKALAKRRPGSTYEMDRRQS